MITLLSIVPHSAEVERLFSNLGGVQCVECRNLSVCTFETVGKLPNNYSYHLYQCATALGKPVCQKHAHMHTRKDGRIDVDLAKDLETNFTWTPPLATNVSANSADLEGPESISEEEIEAAFAELEQLNRGTQEAALDPQLDGQVISVGKVYDFVELDRVDKGLVPTAFEDDNDQIGTESASGSWDIQSMLISKGVTT